MSDPTGGPAFPSKQHYADTYASGGITLRDYFAAKAIPELLAYELSPKGAYQHVCESSADGIAHNAYAIADAMLRVREAKP